MGFRDEREAATARIEALERALATTKTDLDAAKLRATEAEHLRTQLEELTRERTTLLADRSRAQASRNRQLAVGFAITSLVSVAAGIGAHLIDDREVRVQTALRERANRDLTDCEAIGEPLRRQRDAARAELEQIDAIHAGELERVRHEATSARPYGPGSALLLVAEVVSRGGYVPAGVANDCVLAVRGVRLGICSATLVCDGTQVFPPNDPPWDVSCTALDGSPWAVGSRAELGTLRAVERDGPELLAYDARRHAIDIRATGDPAFVLHLRVTSTVPFRLP